MGWIEHLGTNKYKLIERDPSKVSKPKRSTRVTVPDDIVKSERKREKWLALQLAEWEEKVISGQATGRQKTEKLSFEEFIPMWEKGFGNQNLGDKTFLNTKSIIDSRLIPEFGQTQINKITTLQLVTWFAGLTNLKTGKPLATNSKLNIYKAAKSIFDAATDWKVIKENPMVGVQRPTIGKKEKKAMKSVKKSYSTFEVEKLLTALYGLPNRWRLYFTGVILGGFRRGEMLAVEWSHVDYEHGALYIENQITLDRQGNKTEAEVKTEESEGWVAMPKWYMEELKRYEWEWKKERLSCRKWEGGNKQYIFHGGSGIMYYPTTPTSTWRKFLAANNLPHVKLHGLRHTAGMLLRESGADLKTMQERLRHTKIGTTMDIYTHESDIISREAADRLEGLNPKQQKFAP